MSHKVINIGKHAIIHAQIVTTSKLQYQCKQHSVCDTNTTRNNTNASSLSALPKVV